MTEYMFCDFLEAFSNVFRIRNNCMSFSVDNTDGGQEEIMF